jgi:hypothetical protein
VLGLLCVLFSQGPLGCSSLPRRAAQGDVAAVKASLDKGARVDSTDYKQRSPLELSIILEHEDVFDLLIAEGADVNRRGKGSRTPLIWASMRWGTPQMIHKLVDAGADPNGTDKAGQTPLFYAVLYGSRAQLAALIERGADINHIMQPKWQAPVLSVAIRQKRLEMVELLVASGADLEWTDAKGRNAHQLAQRRAGMAYAIDRGLEGRGEQTQIVAAAKPMRSSPAPATSTKPQPQAKPKPLAPKKPAPAPAPAVEVARPSTVQSIAPMPVVASVVPRRNSKSKELRLGEYHALVIGNNDYPDLPKLQTAVNDAKALSALLRDRYGYTVNTLLNATRSEILQALSQYRRILTDQDNLLIYYAGHGWLDEDADRGYWLPIDATQNDDIHWIANESITSKTRAMEAKHVMIIADSCYSGKLIRGIHVNQNTPNYLKRLATRRARVVLTSGGIEPVSDAGGRDNHSVFASALLRALEENNDVLEGHELFSQVRRPVAVNSDQIPEYSDIRKAGHDGGDFLFILP